MNEKRQLIIPEKMKKLVHPNLLERNGEISDHWREDIPEDWLRDVKEPKVLTADEWLYDNAQPYSNPIRMQLAPIFNAGHKNGRLEMRLQFRPLIEVTEKFISHANGFNYHREGSYGFMKSWHESFTNALENLKPLNDE